MGLSGLLAVDFDVHRTPDGEVETDGFDNWAEEWLDLPETFHFDSVSGSGGTQHVFLAPENRNLTLSNNYRGIEGVDIRAGGSYSVFTAAPDSFADFKPAPEWACDVKPERDLSGFEGSIKEWFESLVPGEPSLPVRNAIAKVEKAFTDQNNDLTHAQIVEFQHNAIRLGAEGHPGVEELLTRIEELTLEREGAHSRNPDEYQHEFKEALDSGIKKHGDAIQLLKDMPPYSLDLVPLGTPERFITGPPGDNATFSATLAELVKREPDDLKVLSVLWSLPTTRDVAREWGLEWVLDKRIRRARTNPEPVGENPVLEAHALETTYVSLLTHEEKEEVRKHPTFIDQYLEVDAGKGFQNLAYAIPAAWTLFSMAFGTKVRIPKGKPFGVNLWFLTFGSSGTGKTSTNGLLKTCLDLMLKDGESGYNLGASSSAEGMHETLLERDGKSTMIHEDEAAKFFSALKRKDWMSGISHHLNDWYEGDVPPSNKVRLKELKGKSAKTSFSMYMIGTPEDILANIDEEMFYSGFMPRFNWGWSEEPEDDDMEYMISWSETDDNGINPRAYDLVADLLLCAKDLPPNGVNMSATDEATDRAFLLHKKMDEVAKKREKYRATKPSILRLGRETMWKCAALTALWRGESVIRDIDMMTAAYYVEEWFNKLFEVINLVGQGDFNRDANEIESFVSASPNGVSQQRLYHKFGSMIERGPRELEDRITYLLMSGRILREENAGRVKYLVNGVAE